MRITAGKHRKRSIEAPKGTNVRPTSSMVREAIFNVVMHAEPPAEQSSLLVGQLVADICCGCGTLGIESLSRGAESAVFVDSSRESLEQTRKNISKLGEDDNADFIRADATNLPPAKAPASIVFMDPPYGRNLVAPIIKSVLAGGWIIEGGIIAVELSLRDETPEVDGVELIKEKVYGKSKLAFYAFT